MGKLENYTTQELLAELKSRDLNVVGVRGEILKTQYDVEFRCATYKITKVTNASSLAPKVGDIHRCWVCEHVGLIVADVDNLRGRYYIAEGELIKEPESFKEYLENLNLNKLEPYFLPYYYELCEKYDVKSE